MKKYLGIFATLILALGVTTNAFANTASADSTKTKSVAAAKSTANKMKPKKHRKHRAAKKAKAAATPATK